MRGKGNCTRSTDVILSPALLVACRKKHHVDIHLGVGIGVSQKCNPRWMYVPLKSTISTQTVYIKLPLGPFSLNQFWCSHISPLVFQKDEQRRAAKAMISQAALETDIVVISDRLSSSQKVGRRFDEWGLREWSRTED